MVTVTFQRAPKEVEEKLCRIAIVIAIIRPNNSKALPAISRTLALNQNISQGPVER